MADSPTKRSMDRLRAEGWLVEVVERWIPRVNIRKDLWGFIDLLAIKDGEVLAVQATSGSNVSGRVKKIAEHENIEQVRMLGWRIEVWGWRKSARNRWVLRVVDVS